MQCPVDDAFEVTRSRRTRIHPVVDIDPGVRRTVVGVHGQLVTPVAQRHALGAVQGGQVVIGELPDDPVYMSAVERLDGGHAALIDQPVVVGQHRPPGIGGVGATLRHLPHAQVRPVRKVGLTARRHHDFDVSGAVQPRGAVQRRAEVVLICYEHNRITALVQGIPTVDGTVIPAVWPDDRFDVIWTFTLDRDGARYVFGQVPQQLLGGDTDTVI